MRRPLLRYRWDDARQAPSPTPWAYRAWFCVALIPGVAWTWWKHCRWHTPPRYRWELGLAWLYWRTWYWSDWR